MSRLFIEFGLGSLLGAFRKVLCLKIGNGMQITVSINNVTFFVAKTHIHCHIFIASVFVR